MTISVPVGHLRLLLRSYLLSVRASATFSSTISDANLFSFQTLFPLFLRSSTGLLCFVDLRLYMRNLNVQVVLEFTSSTIETVTLECRLECLLHGDRKNFWVSLLVYLTTRVLSNIMDFHFILHTFHSILWIRLCNTIFCTNLINRNVNVHPNSDFYEHHCSQLSTERKWNRIYIEIRFINVTTSTIFSIFYSNNVQMFYVATVGYCYNYCNITNIINDRLFSVLCRRIENYLTHRPSTISDHLQFLSAFCILIIHY